MNPIILIPARMASTRLPGKPMRLFGGVPMVVHVSAAATQAGVGVVAVACDGEEIADAVARAGYKAVLTDPDLPSGSDRIFAALQKIDAGKKYDVVINLQGDMLKFQPEYLKTALALLKNPMVDIATLATPIREPEKINDPAVVKAVIAFENTKQGRARTFTRKAAASSDSNYYEHIGVYVYRRAALEKFVTLPQSPLEKEEKLEQLRAVEAGMRIDVAVVDEAPVSIDTEEQARAAETLYKENL